VISYKAQQGMLMLQQIIKQVRPELTLTILDIGAVPIAGQEEKAYGLVRDFPGSRIIGFEVDPEVCDRINRTTEDHMTFYPVALGRAEEERIFYRTVHPMCASLYEPDAELLARYQNMEVCQPKGPSQIRTVGLDQFVRENRIGTVDFIKIDIQGAELDVFQGAIATLKETLAVVSEVEFIPLYRNQPLFGDVCAFLAGEGFQFHKFIGMSARALKTTMLCGSINVPTQHLWGNAMFFRDIHAPAVFSDDQLLKTAVIANHYGSPDVALACLMSFDSRYGCNTAHTYSAALQKAFSSSRA